MKLNMVLTLLGLVASKEAVFVSPETMHIYDVFTGKKHCSSFEIQCVEALSDGILSSLLGKTRVNSTAIDGRSTGLHGIGCRWS